MTASDLSRCEIDINFVYFLLLLQDKYKTEESEKINTITGGKCYNWQTA